MESPTLPAKYAYLIGCTFFVAIWLLLYYFKPKFRQEMLFTSVFGIVLGPTANYLWYLKDWWKPAYIFGTNLPEDILLGFATAGITSVIYEALLNKKYNKKVTLKKKNYMPVVIRFLRVFLSTLIPILILFYIFKVHSFYANIVGLGIGGTYILLMRKDLIQDALGTAILLPIVALPGFWIPELLYPEWVPTHWMLQNLSGVVLLGAPLEDLVWYAFSGFCLGSVFEYLFEYKIK